jgi:type VII secretion integral membrane protein EccD
MALPYSAAAGLLFAAGDTAGLTFGADALLVGACALLFVSAVGAVGIGHGLRVFVAGGTLGFAVLIGALLRIPLTGPRAAAIVVVVLVAGIGLAPLLSVRVGRLPLPVVTASPQVLAGERRPPRPEVLAAVVRADEILVGSLTGISLASAGCVAILTAAGGIAGPLLGGLASGALLLRARLFPAVAARLPLLVSGLVGLALTASAAAAASGSATRLLGVALAFSAVVALLATAATAHRRRTGASPYLGRLADILDVVTVVALAPVACAVLDVFTWVRGLAG